MAFWITTTTKTLLVVSLLVFSQSLVTCQSPEDLIVPENPTTTISTTTSQQSIVTSTTAAAEGANAANAATALPPPAPTTTSAPSMSATTNKCRSAAQSPNANKVDYVDMILKSKENNTDKIIDMLRKAQADNCMYGCDPKLDDLCPDLVKTRSYNMSIANLKEIRISDVRALVIDYDIVIALAEKCPIGEWCLTDTLLDRLGTRINQTSTSMASLAANQKLFCLIESCFASIQYYTERCVENDLNSHIVQLAPEFCNFDIENTQNEFCVENSLRLLHVAAAFYELNQQERGPTPDVCREDLTVNNECMGSCKNMANAINKLTSCCAETKLIKSFKSFAWYFDNFSLVKHTCGLPIKSICFSDGKYYLGISPRILVVSIIASVILTTLFVTINYMLCCRRRRSHFRSTKVYDESVTDMYEYAHLNPCAEDENISLNHASLGEEFGLANYNNDPNQPKTTSLNNMLFDSNSAAEEKVLFVDANHNNISKFVNSHQTDIRSLFD